MNGSSNADAALWADVCLAAAWFDRARKAALDANAWKTNDSSAAATGAASVASTDGSEGSNGANGANGLEEDRFPDAELSPDNRPRHVRCALKFQEAISSAQQALSLYQSCFQRVRQRSDRKTRPDAESHSSLQDDMGERNELGQTVARLVDKVRSDPPQEFTINLELRIAHAFRFLAHLHARRSPDGLEPAIRCHDDAVSLLVGVFDDGEWEERQAGIDDGVEGSLLSIRVRGHGHSVRASFVVPDEDQRVRAIAASLNALAQLHEWRGDDRASMDAYREALEILRAATEEKGSDDSSGGTGTTSSSSSKDAPPAGSQADLAITLMNVGNFHLRRDELDAALYAFSTAWALRIGHDTSLHPPKPAERPLTCSPGALAALNNLGIVHERRGEYEEALSCHDHVRRVRIERLGPDHWEVANSWINVANCLQRLEEWEGASMGYQEAAAIYRELESDKARDPGVAMERVFHQLAGALRNWATCHWKQHQVSDAIGLFLEAVEMESQVVSHSLASGSALASTAKESIAQMFGILGCLYCEQSEELSQDVARDAFMKAIRIYEELGFSATHSAVIWTKNNLETAGNLQNFVTPEPNDIDSVDLDRFLSSNTEDEDDGSIFSGLEDDECVSRRTQDSKRRMKCVVIKSFAGDNATSKLTLVVDDVVKVVKKESDEWWWGVRLDGQEGRFPPSCVQLVKDDSDDIASCSSGTHGWKSVKKSKKGHKKGVPSFSEDVDFDAGFTDTEALAGGTSHPLSKIVESEKSNESSGSKPHVKRINSGSVLAEDRQRASRADDKTLTKCAGHLRQQKGQHGSESVEAAIALVSLAEHYKDRKEHATAVVYYTEALAVYRKKLGDSKEVADILKVLGDSNKEMDKLDMAKRYYMGALEMEKAVLGQYLPSTLNAAGAICLQEDDFRSAMEYHRKALQIQKKSLGEQSKYEMYETLVRIGAVYYNERNNLTNIRSKGVDYKEFIESGFLGWIANAHDMRGEYIMAIQFYEESLQILISRDSKESKNGMALTLNRLGSLNRELGRYIEGSDYHQKALHLQQSTSNVAKAMTAETCVLMGMVKAKMGEYRRALDLYEDSLLVLKSSLGNEHLSVAKTLAQMGAVHFELCEYDKAMSILLSAERIQVASAGEKNRDTLETQAFIGRVLSSMGKFDSAMEKLKGVAEKQTAIFGANHPSIAETKQLIGECYLEQGMITEARVMYVECYNMRKLFFSMDQIHIAESMVDIIRARNGRPERALAIYRDAMDVYREYLPDDHVQIGRLLIYEGDAHAELLNFSASVEKYNKATKIFHKAVGKDHVVEADILVNVGKVLLRKCDYDGAKEQFSTALKIYNSKLPDTHPKVSGTLSHLDRVEQEEALCV